MNVVLSGPETRQLLAAILPSHPFAKRDRALVVFALHTGLRVSELSGLNIGHVAHLGQARLRLFLPPELGKGGRARILHLNAIAQKCVRVLLSFNAERGFSTAPDQPLFQNRFHRRLSVRDIQRLVKALREVAGLDVPATPHALRHTFATQLVEVTQNVRVAQQALGHKRLNTTEVYTHPSPALMAASFSALVR